MDTWRGILLELDGTGVLNQFPHEAFTRLTELMYGREMALDMYNRIEANSWMKDA